MKKLLLTTALIFGTWIVPQQKANAHGRDILPVALMVAAGAVLAHNHGHVDRSPRREEPPRRVVVVERGIRRHWSRGRNLSFNDHNGHYGHGRYRSH